MNITKLDAAKSQLATAISLYIELLLSGVEPRRAALVAKIIELRHVQARGPLVSAASRAA